MVVGMWYVYRMIERDCWYVFVLWDPGFLYDENGWALLDEKEKNRWSAGQQRTRVPTIHSERKRGGR